MKLMVRLTPHREGHYHGALIMGKSRLVSAPLYGSWRVKTLKQPGEAMPCQGAHTETEFVSTCLSLIDDFSPYSYKELAFNFMKVPHKIPHQGVIRC